MARRDLIVSFLSSVSEEVLGMFTDRPLTLPSPVGQRATEKYPGGRPGYQQWISQFADGSGNVIPGMFRAAGGQPGDTIGRVCVMGFSNGCIGVDEVLRKNDSAKIDLVLAVDGIHGAYMNEGGKKVLAASAYKRFLNHAAYVLNQPGQSSSSPVMVVTHSSIVPPGFPSTTETANYIWETAMTRAVPGQVETLRCGYGCPPVMNVETLRKVMFPGGKKICSSVGSGCFTWGGFADGWYDRRAANNFFVMGWGKDVDGRMKTVDPTGNADHIFQGRVILTELLKHFAVARWNRNCGTIVTTAGWTSDAAACALGDGLAYSETDVKKVDLFPEIGEGGGAVIPTCPAPPPGYVIVGAPGDPCFAVPKGTAGEPPVAPPLPVAPKSVWNKALWLGAGLAVGYGGVQLLTRERR